MCTGIDVSKIKKEGQNVAITDESIGIPNGGTCPICHPKSTPMVMWNQVAKQPSSSSVLEMPKAHFISYW